jgi:hypothetical protein
LPVASPMLSLYIISARCRVRAYFIISLTSPCTYVCHPAAHPNFGWLRFCIWGSIGRFV